MARSGFASGARSRAPAYFLSVAGRRVNKTSVDANRRSNLGTVFPFQVIDISAVGLGERRAFDEQNILGVELGAEREVI